MQNKEHKELPLREFDRAAEKFDDNDSSVYNMCRKDYPEKKYTGIDLSEKMIETARRKHMKGIHFVVGDCENLPFAENSFDAVTCSMRFHHYPNPEEFFRSLNQVLRPGGWFVLRDMASNSSLIM